jgi:FlaA1/EpsC-like NDP-sugar epimerase
MKIESRSGAAQAAAASPGTFSAVFDCARIAALECVQMVLDVGIYLACLELALYFRTSASVGFSFEHRVFFCGVLAVCFYFRSLYEFKTWMFWDEMREALKASFSMFLIMIVFLYALKLHLSRLVIVTSFALFVPTVLAARYLFRRLAVSFGLLKTSILIIGAGKTGEMYARKVERHPFMGCRVMGFLDDDPAKIGKQIAGVFVLGKANDFVEYQSALNVT